MTPRALSVHFLPLLVAPDRLAGAAVVVIDVLRASTTICHALAAGAKAVVPCLEIDDALSAAASFPRDEIVLGGERGGLSIDGFDLGNSPAEYTPASVGDKTVIFTTTNGTAALQHARRANRICIGAFVNAAAVVRKLRIEDEVHFLCAGTRGEITREDVLLAGRLAQGLLDVWLGSVYESSSATAPSREITLNDEASLALAAWHDAKTDGPALPEQLLRSKGGRNLARIGLAKDIDDAAQLDRFDFAPTFDPATGRISPSSASGAA